MSSENEKLNIESCEKKNCEECGAPTWRPRFCENCMARLVENKDPRAGKLLLE